MPLKDSDSLTQHEPTTFHERGVTVPFTTPQLLGTRARRGYKQVLELVTPNPAGGRGVYVTAWNGLAALCRPTLHDRALVEQLAALSSVTPSTIRSVARSVAAAGLAGEVPQEAALSAAGSDETARLVANVRLRQALMPAEDGGTPAAAAAATVARPTEVQARSQAATARAADSVGKSVDWVERALEQIAEALAPIGLADDAPPARMPRLIDLLQKVHSEVVDWSAQQFGGDVKECTDMISSAADFTLTTARSTMDEARVLAKDVMNLLQRYALDANALTGLLTRTEWLLDGWEQVCLVWNYARDDASRRAALVEIVPLIPIIPKEALGWSKIGAKPAAVAPARRMIQMNQDWRTGAAVFALIARNESFLGISS